MFPHPSSFGDRESTRGEDGENGEEWKISTQKTAREHGLQKNVNLFENVYIKDIQFAHLNVRVISKELPFFRVPFFSMKCFSVMT